MLCELRPKGLSTGPRDSLFFLGHVLHNQQHDLRPCKLWVQSAQGVEINGTHRNLVHLYVYIVSVFQKSEMFLGNHLAEVV